MLALRNKIKAGFTIMRSNNRLLFIGVLVFVFPILFVAVVQSFFATSKANIETSERRQVGILHDAIAVLLQEYPTNSYQIESFIESQKSQPGGITEIRVVEKNSTGFLIVESFAEEKIGSYEQNVDAYKSIPLSNSSPFIFALDNGSYRSWQAVRSVEALNGTTYYIFTEHSFQKLDSVMSARQQQSYFGLTAIFIFLISLAYWFAKQVDWQRKYQALEENLKERDLFTNMIAHEFRTPLTAIRGYASFLDESKTITGDEQKFVDTIQLSANRMLVIKEVLETLLPIAKEKNLQLMYKPLAVPIVMKTDGKRLHQVLQNLISNSIKYTQTGIVEVSIETSPKSVVIRIKDTGMGISAEDQQKLFAPFARVGGVEKTGTVGTGLGMWITKQYVELLKGSISVESIKNVGTHVVLTFKR